MPDITIRFAETDADVVAVHGFLCVTLGPTLPGQIDPQDSSVEVWRVVNRECCLMAMRDGFLVGTLGIVKAKWWWGKGEFLANRWLAALPGLGIGNMLLKAGAEFAKGLTSPENPYGLELHIFDEAKGRLVILNKHPARKSVNPLLQSPPKATHEANLTTH